jgi:hypothetical protein
MPDRSQLCDSQSYIFFDDNSDLSTRYGKDIIIDINHSAVLYGWFKTLRMHQYTYLLIIAIDNVFQIDMNTKYVQFYDCGAVIAVDQPDHHKQVLSSTIGASRNLRLKYQ